MIFKIQNLIHHILKKLNKNNITNGLNPFVIKIVQDNIVEKMKVFLLNNK